MNLKNLEEYFRVNLLGPGPLLIKKRNNRAAVSQRLRNTGIYDRCPIRLYYNITILTILLQLPTVLSSVTCCTGLYSLGTIGYTI